MRRSVLLNRRFASTRVIGGKSALTPTLVFGNLSLAKTRAQDPCTGFDTAQLTSEVQDANIRSTFITYH